MSTKSNDACFDANVANIPSTPAISPMMIRTGPSVRIPRKTYVPDATTTKTMAMDAKTSIMFRSVE